MLGLRCLWIFKAGGEYIVGCEYLGRGGYKRGSWYKSDEVIMVRGYSEGFGVFLR